MTKSDDYQPTSVQTRCCHWLIQTSNSPWTGFGEAVFIDEFNSKKNRNESEGAYLIPGKI